MLVVVHESRLRLYKTKVLCMCVVCCKVACMMWEWLKKLYSCYMATVVVIINGHGLGIGMRHRHQPHKSYPALTNST